MHINYLIYSKGKVLRTLSLGAIGFIFMRYLCVRFSIKMSHSLIACWICSG